MFSISETTHRTKIIIENHNLINDVVTLFYIPFHIFCFSVLAPIQYYHKKGTNSWQVSTDMAILLQYCSKIKCETVTKPLKICMK